MAGRKRTSVTAKPRLQRLQTDPTGVTTQPAVPSGPDSVLEPVYEADPEGRRVVHHRTVDTLGIMLRAGGIWRKPAPTSLPGSASGKGSTRDWSPGSRTTLKRLTFYRLPSQHHKHLKRTNMLEWLDEEIKRRTHVMRIFPNTESCLRLVRALCVEIHENFLEGHRYLNMDDLRELKKEALRQAAMPPSPATSHSDPIAIESAATAPPESELLLLPIAIERAPTVSGVPATALRLLEYPMAAA